MTPAAFIALGSNLGDSTDTILKATDALQAFSSSPITRSSLWASAPVDCPPGSPPFINAVVCITPWPGETPESLLQKLLTLEKQFGRKPKTLFNEPRPLDLDLVSFGAEVRDTPDLTLPHPRAMLRRFVLEPLVEIAPGMILPGQTTPVSELLSNLPPGDCRRVSS